MKIWITVLFFSISAYAQASSAPAVEVGQRVGVSVPQLKAIPSFREWSNWTFRPANTTTSSGYAYTSFSRGVSVDNLRRYEYQRGRERLYDWVGNGVEAATGLRFVRQEPIPNVLLPLHGQKGWWLCKHVGLNACFGLAHPTWDKPSYLGPKTLRDKSREYFFGPHLEYTWPKR